MKNISTILAAAAFGALAILPLQASAVTCAAGVYRAGCAGPNGAVVTRRPPPAAVVVRPPVVVHPAPVTCVNGVYRAGCAGPHGAAVVRKY